TMTSAVCATGLIVLDTPKDFTIFGQLVILAGIQLGGLGYSTMATLLLLAVGRRIGLRQRMMMMEVLSTLSMEGLVRFVKIILGGIGFLVFRDILDNFHGERVRFSTHTKLAVLVTGFLIVGGTAGIWGFEIHNDRTLGALSTGEQIMVAYFHSVSARTAGFN